VAYFFGNSIFLMYNVSLTSVLFLHRKTSLHTEWYLNLI